MSTQTDTRSAFRRWQKPRKTWLFNPYAWTPVGLAGIWALTWIKPEAPISPWVAIPLFAAGVLLWTLIEYSLHRFAFHSLSRSELAREFNSTLHKWHHDDTKNPDFLASPTVLSWPVFLITTALAQLALGRWVLTASLMTGLSLGYLGYEAIHAMSHLVNPPTAFLKGLKRHHMAHHFISPQLKFGVTTGFWDRVFGTMNPAPGTSGAKRTIST